MSVNEGVQWRKVTLMGVGLLGGSLGLALRQRALAAQVVGLVRRPASREECRQVGAVDEATLDPVEAVRGADLVVLCTPIARMAELLERALPGLERGALVTDVGSVKQGVIERLEPLAARAGARFIGSHPMAGGEKMGVAHARADLFEGAVCVVTPNAEADENGARRIEQLWASVGGRPLRLPAGLHDELVSRSSHLPHVVAAELADYVLDPGHPEAQARLCANGFRDTTRIASGSPEMWRDICLANRVNLGRALDAFLAELQCFRRHLERGDAEAIEAFFARAKARRDAWNHQASSPSPE